MKKYLPHTILISILILLTLIITKKIDIEKIDKCSNNSNANNIYIYIENKHLNEAVELVVTKGKRRVDLMAWN